MDKKLLHEKQVAEAIKRLDILVKQGLMQEVKDTFVKDGTPYYSYAGGILYWLTENNNCDNLVKVKKEFEKKHNAIVYKAILNNTEIGDMLSLLYVSSHTEEWQRDRAELKEGYP